MINLKFQFPKYSQPLQYGYFITNDCFSVHSSTGVGFCFAGLLYQSFLIKKQFKAIGVCFNFQIKWNVLKLNWTKCWTISIFCEIPYSNYILFYDAL